MKLPPGYAAVAIKIIFNILEVSVNPKRYKATDSAEDHDTTNYAAAGAQQTKKTERQVVADNIGIIL